ncbi:Flagellar hook-associated protein [Azotobacter vinelandii CA]|uniref:Flagellar hook-associated protein 2 n=2 Tax=Azotobacter vinelandii TaxID=354 RepID=C1DHL7_AZOVD|nr:flagellar filament capping protein FliD [Azotobacter vinelandii]ACO78612.1 Flagellar hook-associated protein [Azotobacter vinelandii DJ]AGK13492.1 Flagellar hook-associated protein [Azotobacter vinelandii CA]AGK17906.1 Flagellar hook-associated protein [Azotobacter vinelandii CA6]WKN24292.1 flagellar filament capping protein FliD [Azotobacter vinelandii]SFX90040.1 flagellar hook-associated protein 2 [Azotobacter vinelandii]
MATISSLGVGSGLDLTGLLDQLESAERQKLTVITNQQSVISSKISAFGSLQSVLTSLQGTVETLATASTYQGQTSSISGSGVAVAVTADAVPGSYQVQVSQLAQAHSLASSGVADKTAAAATGTLTIQSGDETLEIELSEGSNSLEDIRDAINAGDGGVTASLVNDGSGTPWRLVLTAKATGTEAEISVGGSAAAALGFTTTTEAKDAQLTVNGIAITSQGNTVEGALQGVTLTLSATGDAQTLTVKRDTGSIKTAINSFVSAYNALDSVADSLTSYDSDSGDAGVLLGDSTLRGVQSKLRQAITGGLDEGTYRYLSDLGISLQLDGTLKVDDSKLSEALEGDLTDIQALFVGTDEQPGLAAGLGDSLDAILDEDGALSSAIEGLESRNEALGERYTRMESSIETLMARYTEQFSALDTLIAQMNSTSSYLTQQFDALNAMLSDS